MPAICEKSALFIVLPNEPQTHTRQDLNTSVTQPGTPSSKPKPRKQGGQAQTPFLDTIGSAHNWVNLTMIFLFFSFIKALLIPA
jgi:hypothetical protein